MGSGFLALVLHAHLPFVRHPEHEDFLEEDWLFEAITESYLPLIAMMQRLVRDEVPVKLTMTVTPTLCAMLGDELLRARYVRYLDRALELAAREMERNKDDAHLRALAECFLMDEEFLHAFRRCPAHAVVADIRIGTSDGYDLLKAIRDTNAEYKGFTPVIAVTGFASQEDKDRAIAAGFSGYFAKPFNPAEVVEAVGELLSHPQNLAA